MNGHAPYMVVFFHYDKIRSFYISERITLSQGLGRILGRKNETDRDKMLKNR